MLGPNNYLTNCSSATSSFAQSAIYQPPNFLSQFVYPSGTFLLKIITLFYWRGADESE